MTKTAQLSCVLVNHGTQKCHPRPALVLVKSTPDLQEQTLLFVMRDIVRALDRRICTRQVVDRYPVISCQSK